MTNTFIISLLVTWMHWITVFFFFQINKLKFRIWQKSNEFCWSKEHYRLFGMTQRISLSSSAIRILVEFPSRSGSYIFLCRNWTALGTATAVCHFGHEIILYHIYSLSWWRFCIHVAYFELLQARLHYFTIIFTRL